jgi:hypothetical protein
MIPQNPLPQAGGHRLLKKTAYVVPTIVKPTRETELTFYQNPPTSLIPYIPRFYGGGVIEDVREHFSEAEWDVIIAKKYTHYILLENLVTEISPALSIVDIKLGSIHWKTDEDPKIIENHQTRNEKSLTASHKWRLDGAYYVCDFNKDECRNFVIEQVDSIMMIFNKVEIDIIIGHIDKLIGALCNTNVDIYGPSLLLVKTSNLLRVMLIDFAIFEIDGEDDLVPALRSFKKFLIER